MIAFYSTGGVSMDVRNCKECGKIFNYMEGTPLCPNCIKKLNDQYEQVKQYVYDNPKATINQVAEENDVSVAQIKRWIREEKLAFAETSDIGLACEHCGAMILTGRYCKDCKKKMEMQFGNAYQEKEEKKVEKKKKSDTGAKMRFLDR